MKNAIGYFYHIYLETVEKINNNFYFYYAGNSYVIYLYVRDTKELLELYQLNRYMLSRGIPVYEIVLTVWNNVAFDFENNLYVLMKLPNINNRTIGINDLNMFKGLLGDNKYNLLDKSHWSLFWENRVDYVEKQVYEFDGKYPLIEESVSYYIGLCENAISYFNHNRVSNVKLEICHRRVTNDMDLLEFLNPLSLVIDYGVRDVAEYFKSFVLNSNYTETEIMEFLNGINLGRLDAILFIVRFMFPSYYFDLYDQVISSYRDEGILNDIIKKHRYIESVLVILFRKYYFYNLPYIDWLSYSDYISS